MDSASVDSAHSRNFFCNNCRKFGHVFNKCKLPVVSFGILNFRTSPSLGTQFLLIRRKRTLGFIDFIRGKYSANNKFYLLNMFIQMTRHEKLSIRYLPFDELWRRMWSSSELNELITDEELAIVESGGALQFAPSCTTGSSQYRQEEMSSKSKFQALSKGIHFNGETYDLETLIQKSSQSEEWDEQEWGFPKGRRNYQENEYDCAVREFTEETGYSPDLLKPISNIYPFEEVFTGSNYRSYKHKYFLTYMDYEESMKHVFVPNMEVSKMEWLTFEECQSKIRNYNKEKLQLITKANRCVHDYII